MRSGFFGRVSGATSTLWNPSLIFSPGTLGGWYDPSDLSSMFQDSSGTISAAIDQPVGKINDKSGNGNHLTQTNNSLRPTLRQSGSSYYLEFGGGGQVLTGSSTSSFKFLHLFSNGAHAAVAARSGNSSDPNAAYAFFGTGAATGGSIGFTLFHDTRDGIRDRQVALLTGRGTAVYTGETAAGSAPAMTDISVAASMAPNASSPPAILYLDNVNSASIPMTVSPIDADSTYPFQLGAAGNSVISFVGRIYQAILYDRQATSEERANIEVWMQSKMP